jgi:hypothetical protein
LLVDATVPESLWDAQDALLGYLERNAYRMDYLRYRQRGLKIGSGAMEALHRTASQVRLKRPGSRWLAETSQAIFNVRMMRLAGRWDEFWSQADLTEQLARVFGNAATTNHHLAMAA